METKIITIHSPVSKTGVTTIAHLLGQTLATSNNKVLIVEMNKHVGFSTYLNKSIDKVFQSLKNCLINPDKVSENIIKSKYNPNCYFICNSFETVLGENMSYNASNVVRCIKRVSDVFSYIIIDLNSDPFDPTTSLMFGGKSTLPIHQHFEIFDENIECPKRFNDLGAMLTQSRYDSNFKVNTTLVVNKSHKVYTSIFPASFSQMPFFSINNIVDIPYIEGYHILCNEGRMTDIGKSAGSKEFQNSIKLLAKIAEKDITGVGNILTRKVDKEKTIEKKRKGLFSKGTSKPKNEPKAKKAKPKKEPKKKETK